MKPQTLKRAILLQVNSSKEKVFRICSLARSYFEKKHHLLIFTADEHSALFVDKLLWAYPKESLLPHEINLTHSKEFICITYGEKNSNGSLSILNLTGEPVSNNVYRTIYDFEDLSGEESRGQSRKKLSYYKESGYSIASF